MASPQIEHGFTRIANEILEALIKEKLSGQELQAILFVIRKTYGFKKVEDIISLSQFSEAMDILKIRAHQVVKSLVSKNILIIKKSDKRNVFFNKDFETWKTAKGKKLMKTLTTKDIRTKEKIIQELKTKEVKNNIDDMILTLINKNSDFKDVWYNWIQHRKEIKHTLTPKTTEGQLKKFLKWGVEKAIVSINNSIDNGYQGLFEPRDMISNNSYVDYDKINKENERGITVTCEKCGNDYREKNWRQKPFICKICRGEKK